MSQTASQPRQRLHKGIYYYARYEDARPIADRLGITRIIPYELGYALQWRAGGAYYGTINPTNPYQE